MLKTSWQTLRHVVREYQSFAGVILPKKVLELSINSIPFMYAPEEP